MSIKAMGKMLGLSATAGFGVGVVGGGAVTYLMGYHRGKKDQRKKKKKHKTTHLNPGGKYSYKVTSYTK